MGKCHPESRWHVRSEMRCVYGSECYHALRVRPKSDLTEQTSRMVWRPYACRLSHHIVCDGRDPKCVTEISKHGISGETLPAISDLVLPEVYRGA
mmetsp:Transcript_31017/g.31569  ORF Transcript_31017/g.31569 Transcript_31017/m.31569 type:complete len:95 (+) Transcript_31017:168-452(+)